MVGDSALFPGYNGRPLPGVAPVAMQQGEFVAGLIDRRACGKPAADAFEYRDKGSMATIGRSKAVVDMGWVRFSGKIAWLFVHILYLARFSNRVLVLWQWTWNYFTRTTAPPGSSPAVRRSGPGCPSARGPRVGAAK